MVRSHGTRLPLRLALAAALSMVPLAVRDARADEAQPTPDATGSDSRGLGWRDVALFAGGAATAFAAHEAGHVVANLALGNTPHVESVSFLGFVPFFAVSPGISCFRNDGCVNRDGARFGAGQRGLLLILLAGFDVQHVTDEVLLTNDPALRLHHAPFRTGLLAFNTMTSAAYAIANLGGFEPVAGDLHSAFSDTRASRAWTTGLLLGIAGLDVARWIKPENRWLAWISRGAKVAFLGLPLSI
jgi:hypothetical protein